MLCLSMCVCVCVLECVCVCVCVNMLQMYWRVCNACNNNNKVHLKKNFHLLSQACRPGVAVTFGSRGSSCPWPCSGVNSLVGFKHLFALSWHNEAVIVAPSGSRVTARAFCLHHVPHPLAIIFWFVKRVDCSVGTKLESNCGGISCGALFLRTFFHNTLRETSTSVEMLWTNCNLIKYRCPLLIS